MSGAFTNMKDLYRMQREAKQMQKKLRGKQISGESKDGLVVVFMNAAQEFEDLHIDESLLDTGSLDLIRDGMKQAFKDFQKKLQKEMAKDFDLDQLKGMLGK